MTADKDFKRLVRTRMHKTGESYTTARVQILNKSRPMAKPVAASSSPSAYAALAGLSDAALKAKTGCTWERWVKALDYQQAYEWPHREIAAFVREKYKVPSWWRQTVTVGYERIKGLRGCKDYWTDRLSALTEVLKPAVRSARSPARAR